MGMSAIAATIAVLGGGAARGLVVDERVRLWHGDPSD